MPKIFTSRTQKIGEFGEEIVSNYLLKKNFNIIDRNYYKKMGEIDIIVQKENILHFIEVKTVSCETLEKSAHANIKPEDNFTLAKTRKFKKIIEFYLMEKHVSHETIIQIDLITVHISKKEMKARITPFWNILL